VSVQFFTRDAQG